VNPGGSDRALVPYATAGLGGLTLSRHRGAPDVGISAYKNYLTGNLGGGLKYFVARMSGSAGTMVFIVGDNKTAPAFSAQRTRYGHRVQAVWSSRTNYRRSVTG
jgi:hypothetical protein